MMETVVTYFNGYLTEF